MRLLRYIVINSIFAACLWFGVLGESDGAENVALFIAWTISLFSLFTLSDKFMTPFLEKGMPRSVPQWFDAGFDIAVVMVFVWDGRFIIGFFYLLHLILFTVFNQKVEAARKAAQA
jgi:hypothetical protein